MREVYIMPLCIAPLNREMEITKVIADDKTKRHLENLGLNVGGKITGVSSNKGSMIIKVKDGRLALDRALAMKIFVK